MFIVPDHLVRRDIRQPKRSISQRIELLPRPLQCFPSLFESTRIDVFSSADGPVSAQLISRQASFAIISIAWAPSGTSRIARLIGAVANLIAEWKVESTTSERLCIDVSRSSSSRRNSPTFRPVVIPSWTKASFPVSLKVRDCKKALTPINPHTSELQVLRADMIGSTIHGVAEG